MYKTELDWVSAYKKLEAQIEKMKSDVELARDKANETENWVAYSILNLILDNWEKEQ